MNVKRNYRTASSLCTVARKGLHLPLAVQGNKTTVTIPTTNGNQEESIRESHPIAMEESCRMVSLGTAAGTMRTTIDPTKQKKKKTEILEWDGKSTHNTTEREEKWWNKIHLKCIQWLMAYHSSSLV